jgi:hypothetical protein
VARRTAHLGALVALLLVALPTAALAAAASLRSPDGPVHEPTELRVDVGRDGGESVRTVRIRAAATEQREAGSWIEMVCASDCDAGAGTYVVGSASEPARLDPRTGTPLRSDSRLTNGRLGIDVEVHSTFAGLDDRTDIQRFDVVLDAPGSAVGDLAAQVADDQVQLAWRPAPEPDVAGYQIERRTGGGEWQTVGGQLSASASRFDDRPGGGDHEYRVSTVRPRASGGSHVTTTRPVEASVVPPSDGGGDGSGHGAATGDADRDGTATEPDDAEVRRSEPAVPGTPSDDDGDGRDGPRSAVTGEDGVDLDGDGSSELPGLAEALRQHLDHGDRDVVGDDTTVDDDEVVLATPGRSDGGVRGVLGDPHQVAVPVAGGLLLTALALHLWRWLRVPLR